LSSAARFLIWSFFILIFSNALGILAGKFGILAGKPVYYYAAISLGLLVTALATQDLRLLRGDWPFFALWAALVVLGAVMFRNGAGPDFGARIALPLYIPSPAGYVIWPALNLAAGAGLYLYTRSEAFYPTIRSALFVTFLLQGFTMIIDMWWPATFGDPNGRAAGLAQNANQAALSVSLLATLMLPVRRRDTFNIAAPSVIVALALLVLAQSRAGFVMGAILVVALVFARRAIGRFPIKFAASALVILLATVAISPVLNGTVDFPRPMVGGTTGTTTTIDTSHFNEPTTLDRPISLIDRIKERISLDEAASERRAAMAFYLDILRRHPGGLGTGFANKFVVGPHNEFIKLAVDNGLLASALFFALLIYVAWRAFKERSPLLGSLALIAGVASMLYHTLMVDPIVLPALSIGLAHLFYGAPYTPEKT
jgi:hypothetical protein